MNSILSFFLILNLAGWLAVPYFVSKGNPLGWQMPLDFSHKVLALIQIGIGFSYIHTNHLILTPTFTVWVFVVLAYLNILVDFRYCFNKLIKFEIPKFYLGSLSHDLLQLRTFEFEADSKADSNIIWFADDRIVIDLALFLLNIQIIFHIF